jgi:2-iminobutanoate/2-iminopropanoate deaminase
MECRYLNHEIAKLIIMVKSVIFSPTAPEAIGPYSQAIQAGNLLFVSGQIAIQKSTNTIVTGSIEEETAQVLQNIKDILKAAEMDFSNVVKCTIFLKDFNDFAAVNGIYGKSFSTNPPARETVEVSRLPKDVNIEISCIAVK